MALTFISLAFVGGIFLGSLSGLMPPLIAATAFLAILIPFVKRHQKVAILAFSLIALAAGLVRFEFSRPVVDDYDIARFNDGVPVAIRGVIYKDPELSSKTLRLYVRVTEKSTGWEWHGISGNILVFVPEYADYRYGDLLEINGKPETPPVFDDFDYRGYLANQRIYTTMLYPEIWVIDRNQGSWLLSTIYSLRRNIAESIARTLPEPQAAVTNGIILGIRGNIPSPIKDDFAASGTTHVLAISGVNLSIIAAMLAIIFTLVFGKRHGVYIYLTLAVIWGYAVITGLEPPVVRSAVMASLFLTAELLGRQKSALPALAFSGLVMTLADPLVLWDISFQLSFTAMAGLIIICPPFAIIGRRAIEKLFGEEKYVAAIATAVTDSLAASLGATLAILPLTINYFGTLSLVSLPATLIALPALPLIIITGALTGLTGLIMPTVAQFFGYLAWLPVSYLLLVTKVMANIPYSHIAVPSLNIGIVIVYYVLLWLILALSKSWLDKLRASAANFHGFLTNTPVKWLLFPATLAVIVMVSAIVSRPDERLHVSFLDLGQGDAILIQQGTHQILVDGGPDSQTVLNALSKKMPFWDRDIDIVVLTHPDADHITGLIEVMKRYSIGKVLYPERDFVSQAGAAWLDAIKEKNIEKVIARPGQRVTIENTTIEIVLPERPPDDDSVDAGSLSLRVSRGTISFLLTADITTVTERELILERANLQSTVLKAAHHGSAHGTSAEFLAVVDPQVAVISVGKDNNFGHPAPEVLQRLEAKVGKENMYRTDEDGTVEFITDGEKLWVEKEK